MTSTWRVAPLALAVVGTGLMAWSFLAGIDAALNGGGSGALPFEIVFLAALMLVLAALALATVNLVRGHGRGLAIAAIAVGVLPLVAVVVLRAAAVGSA